MQEIIFNASRKYFVFSVLLGLIFVGLKLFDVIACSWWWLLLFPVVMILERLMLTLVVNIIVQRTLKKIFKRYNVDV